MRLAGMFLGGEMDGDGHTEENRYRRRHLP
jgi:hypothetical protein